MLKLKLEENQMSFGCGKDNECGLHLQPIYKSDHTECEIIFNHIHEGWKNIVHGGIISTVMDETMFFEVMRKGYYGVTYSMNIKFKKPVKIGIRYICKAYAKSETNKLIKLHSGLFYENSEATVATATFYKVSRASLEP